MIPLDFRRLFVERIYATHNTSSQIQAAVQPLSGDPAARAAGVPIEMPPLGAYVRDLYLSRFDESLFLSHGADGTLQSHHPTILAIDGVARTLVCEEARAGMFVPPEDGRALAGAIERLADDHPLRERLGRNGRAWVLAHASREVLAQRYVDAMQSLLATRPPTSSDKVPDLYQRCGKRAVNLSVAIVALAVAFPILLLASAVVWFSVGSPILFRHERPGWRGRLFILYKLRTMTDRRAVDGHPLPDAERLTRAGRLIRTLSVDELPQLFNVLRGDMTMVGPRPLLVQYLKRYTPEQARRHEVRPGITGWAQTNGRNTLSWEERFRHDVWYVENWSPGLDARILCRTLWTLSTGRGITQPGSATAEEFRGPVTS